MDSIDGVTPDVFNPRPMILAKRNLAMPIIITAFDGHLMAAGDWRVDLRVRWTLEQVGQLGDICTVSSPLA